MEAVGDNFFTVTWASGLSIASPISTVRIRSMDSVPRVEQHNFPLDDLAASMMETRGMTAYKKPRSHLSPIKVSVISCYGCGAGHIDGEICSYCGRGSLI